jgi:hypothetical protein
MCAANNGHYATAAKLVRLGADINAKDYVRARCGSGAYRVPRANLARSVALPSERATG